MLPGLASMQKVVCKGEGGRWGDAARSDVRLCLSNLFQDGPTLSEKQIELYLPRPIYLGAAWHQIILGHKSDADQISSRFIYGKQENQGWSVLSLLSADK
jgi:hypothetical protein